MTTLSAAQLQSHLTKGLRARYVIQSDEPLLVLEAQDAIVQAAKAQGFDEREVFTVQGATFDWSELQAAFGAQSLFASRKMIELRIPTGKPGLTGAQALQTLATSLPAGAADDLLLLISLPRLDKAASQSAWFTALLDRAVHVNLPAVEPHALGDWIVQRLERQGQHLDGGPEGQAALQQFVARVEGNLLAAHQEVQKLALLYPQGPLSSHDIDAAVLNVARYDVFKLSEAALQGQLLRCQRMIAGLQAEGEAAVLVHHTLSQEIMGLWAVKQAQLQGQPLPVALSQQRVWGARQRLYERVVPQLSPALLLRLLQGAQKVDGIVKGLPAPGWPVDAWDALQLLTQRLCHACKAPSPRQRERQVA